MRGKGSVTVFAALLTVIIASAIFALMEAARVHGIKANARMTTIQAADGILSSYNTELWEEYKLLFWEESSTDLSSLSQACQFQIDLTEGNYAESSLITENYYVLQVHLNEVEANSFRLATDDGGYSFKKQAADIMSVQAAAEAVDTIIEILSDYDGDSESEALESEENAEDILEELKDAVSDAESSAQQEEDSDQQGDSEDSTDSEQSSSGDYSFTLTDNPIQWMIDIQSKGIYAYLLTSEDLSDKAIDLSESIAQRDLNEGNWDDDDDDWSAAESVLLLAYLTDYFDNVTDEGGDRALDYEAEYIIAGKSSDKANLKAVVRRILLIREAADLAYIETDSGKCQEAYSAALSICALVGQPEFTEVVKQAILAAWAFAESLSDVKILLDGGNVPLVKTSDNWNTDLNSLMDDITSAKADKTQSGLDYENYLQILMGTVSEEKLSYRAMTIIESNTGVSMDCMVSDIDFTYSYSASVLFWDFVKIGTGSFSGYSFTDQHSLSYLKQ